MSESLRQVVRARRVLTRVGTLNAVATMRERPAVWIAALLIPSVLGCGIALLDPHPSFILVVLIAAAIAIGLVARLLSGSLDILEPLIPASAAFVIFFVLRPLTDLPHPTLGYSPVPIAPAYNTALLAALVGIGMFNLGYLIPAGVRLASKLPRPPRPEHQFVLVVSAGGLSLVAIAGLVVWAVFTGRGLGALFGSRADLSATMNVPIVSEAAVLATPAFLILWTVRGRWRNLARLSSFIPLAVLLIDAVPRGDRRVLLPFVTALIAYWYLRNGRRPATRTLVVVVLCVFFTVIGPWRVARTGAVNLPTAIAQSVGDPLGSIYKTLRTGDTEMIDTLAIEVAQVGQPNGVPWQYGLSTLTETLLQPIPRQLWPGKPEPIRTQLIELDWGMANGRCTSMCPTFSALGSFWADFGLPSVAVGCLLLGFLLRAWYEYVKRHQDSVCANVAYSATLFMPFMVWWAALSTVVIYVALYALPVFLAMLLASSRHEGSRRYAMTPLPPGNG